MKPKAHVPFIRAGDGDWRAGKKGVLVAHRVGLAAKKPSHNVVGL
jgi:hypothetical protein